MLTYEAWLYKAFYLHNATTKTNRVAEKNSWHTDFRSTSEPLQTCVIPYFNGKELPSVGVDEEFTQEAQRVNKEWIFHLLSGIKSPLARTWNINKNTNVKNSSYFAKHVFKHYNWDVIIKLIWADCNTFMQYLESFLFCTTC